MASSFDEMPVGGGSGAMMGGVADGAYTGGRAESNGSAMNFDDMPVGGGGSGFGGGGDGRSGDMTPKRMSSLSNLKARMKSREASRGDGGQTCTR